MASHAGNGYVPAIDGLRALAVLVILLFHFDIPPFSGGFVGVDVFFVISGFLITGILLGEMRAGRFSLLAFYERRLRRIVPALLVLVAACAIVSPLVFLPTDLREIGTGLYSAVIFASNFFFYNEANDYFAAGNLNLQPMLHTWSLSVEAQFYLFYPLLLLLVVGWRLPVTAVLAAGALASFAASVAAVRIAPSAAFYLLPMRAWELLLGGILAARGPNPSHMRVPRGIIELAGSAMILGPVLLYTRDMPFPGLAALPPCAGAASLILAALAVRQAPGIVGRCLTCAPVVRVGRISYSLYLWHWPIWVMVGYGRSEALTLAERFALMGIAFLPAIASWYYIERPINERRLLAGRRPLLTVLGIGTAVLAAVGVLLDHAGRGEFPIRLLPPDVLALANGQFDWIRGDCWPEDLARPGKPCRFGVPGKAPTVVLWGNSFARMWLPGLDVKARERGVAGLAFHRGKCLPLPDATADDPADCPAFNAAVLDYIRSHPALSTVVLGANWFVAGPQLASLGTTLATLQALGRRVVLIAAPPQPTYPVPRTLALAALRRSPPPPPLLETEARAAQRASTSLIEALRQSYGFAIVDPASFLCNGTLCSVERDGRVLYYDAGHVTAYAARLGKDLFDPVFLP